VGNIRISSAAPGDGQGFDWFPLICALTAALFVLALHLAKGTELGFAISPNSNDQFPTGFLFDPQDNLSYASWAQQARYGSWLGNLAYTTTPNPGVYFNWFFLLVGSLSRFTGQPVPGLLNVLGIVGLMIAIFMTYQAALCCGFSRPAARWTLFVLCLASGLSAVAILVCRILNIPTILARGADITNLQIFGFSGFMAFPYHSFVLGWLALTIWLVLTCDETAAFGWNLALAGVANLMLGALHPYESPLLALTYGLYCLTSLGEHGRASQRRRWIAIVLVASMLPGLIYSLWLSRQALWMQFATLSIQVGARWPRRFWIIGLGAVLPLAVFGCYEIVRQKVPSPARWMAIWLGLVVILLVVFDLSSSKIADGLPVPMSIVTGLGLSRLFEISGGLAQVKVRRAAGAALLGALLLLPVNNVVLVLFLFRANEISGGLWRVLAQIDSHSEYPPVVLANLEVGSVAPGLIGARVFVGHWAISPNFSTSIKSLKAAGFENPATDASIPSSRENFDRLLGSTGARWVVTRTQEPAENYAAHSADLRLVQSSGSWRLYALQPSPLR